MLTPHYRYVFYAYVAVASAVIVGLYWGGLQNLWQRWSFQPEYSHGFLIPLVSAYIFWERRAEWRPALGSMSWRGPILLFSALVVLLVGEISALYLLIHYSLLIALLAFAYTVIARAIHTVVIPIAFLAFAIPLPYFFEVVLSAKLQLLSSSMGVWLIRALDIPVYLSGNVIDLGEFKLHVVEACSGLRYLFPLLSLGVITAYFYQARYWKRIALAISTVPIAIVMNSGRIAVTGWLVNHFGVASAQGFLHDFEGWVVFLLCLAVLLLEILLLERLSTQRRSFAEIFSSNTGVANTKEEVSEQLRWNVHSPMPWFLCLCVVALGVLFAVDRRDEATPLPPSLAGFPLHLNEWVGVRSALTPGVIESLGFSEYVLADYWQGDDQVNFYVAYYATQKKGVSPHSPKVCIPGGGWEIRQFSRTQLNGHPANRVVIQKAEQRQLVYYWFVERGNIVANEYLKKWWLLRDVMIKNRSDGALIRIVVPISEQESLSEAERRAERFAHAADPVILRYLPGE